MDFSNAVPSMCVETALHIKQHNTSRRSQDQQKFQNPPVFVMAEMTLNKPHVNVIAKSIEYPLDTNQEHQNLRSEKGNLSWETLPNNESLSKVNNA